MPNRSLSIYHQSASLLFQFVLEEFLASWPRIVELQHCHIELKSALDGRNQNEVDRILAHMSVAVADLTGSEQVGNMIYPWSAKKGALGKLKHYTHLFDGFEALRTDVSKAFHATLQAREVLWQWRQGSPDEGLFKLLDRIDELAQRLKRHMPEVLTHFGDDENVLLFLLKRQAELAVIYDGLVEMVEGLFSEGLSGLEQHVRQRYFDRGFHQMLPMISSSVAELAGR